MDDNGDPDSQPDQYARDNHLSLDSQIDPFSLPSQLNCLLPQLTLDAGPRALTTDSFLSQLHVPSSHFQEQLDVPKDAIRLLATALQPDVITLHDHLETPLAKYDARKRLADFKFEPPALVSDPDYDCRELARTIQAYRLPDYGPETFPSERLNLALDEGLEFPDSARHFGQELDHIVGHEKLDVPKEAVYRLAGALVNDWSDDETRKVLEGTSSYRTSLRDLIVTPPLSPFTQNEEFFIPDAEVCELPHASDSSSMLSDDLKAAESAILQRELGKDIPPLLDIDTPQLSPLLDQPTLSNELPKVSSMKIESPLSPFTASLYTNEEPSIPALLKSMDIDHALSPKDSSEIVVGQTEGIDCTFDHDLRSFVEEAATAAIKKIEQEQINVVGATARVEVPTTDFSTPVPEWQNLPMDVRAHMKWLHELYNIEIPRWSRSSRADSQLRWVPFLQKIDLQALTNEMIDCERVLSDLLSFPNINDVPTSADYVWKRPGLAILREPESEDDIEEVSPTVETVHDLASLVRKRRLENECVVTGMSNPPESNLSNNLVAPSPLKKPLKENGIAHTNLLPITESNSAVSTLLATYIDIRTAKRRKRSQSSFFLPTSKLGIEPRLDPDPVTSRSREDVSPLPSVTKLSENKVAFPTPCPELTTPGVPTRLIKGLSLSRGLFSRLEQLYPTAEIIERDFDRWHTVAQGHQPVSGPTVLPSVAAEADVIVSAATGIMVTTLLKVIQKPLPGQGGQSSIRERISLAALRYERLIVLVSEGSIVDETVRDLAPSETTAYADFICFAASLNATVEVFYVGGGEVTLAKWLVSFAIRYAPEASEVQGHLTQDETQWEVFLRRLGFNAYAAQAILIRLGRRDSLSRREATCPVPVLARFMMMSAAERSEGFRDLIGERVLRRVNRMLETKWS